MSSSDEQDGRDTVAVASATQIRADLRPAQAEFEASKARPYYDADADHADADRYYLGSTLDKLTAVEPITSQPAAIPARQRVVSVD